MWTVFSNQLCNIQSSIPTIPVKFSFHMAISITFSAMLSDVVGKVFLLLNSILFRERLVIVTSSNPPVLSFHQLMEGCHLKKRLCQYKCTEGGQDGF